jgi:hypothetical membrane protein
MPLVFVLGSATVLSTRYVFFLHHPEYFLRAAGPTISRTAAFAPSSLVFAVGICATALAAATGWTAVAFANAPRCVDAAHARLHRAAVACGLVAALFLALLGIVNSNWNGRLHEAFSVVFYASQSFAFLFDTLWWRRLPAASSCGAARRRGREKAAVCALIFALSTLFLALYLIDKADVLADETALDFAFVVVEYAVSLLCFWYSAAVYRELAAHHAGAASQDETAPALVN